MKDYDYFVGVDWGRTLHQACLVDAQGKLLDEKSFQHGGKGLNSLVEWILK